MDLDAFVHENDKVKNMLTNDGSYIWQRMQMNKVECLSDDNTNDKTNNKTNDKTNDNTNDNTNEFKTKKFQGKLFWKLFYFAPHHQFEKCDDKTN